MRALSIWRPWAELIMLGRKRYELRTWTTQMRGRIAIHASLSLDRESADMAGLSADQLSQGALLGTAELVDCIPFTRNMADELRAERAHFSGWRPGLMAWMLRDPERLRAPVPHRGRQGLFRLPDFVQYHDSEAAGYGCAEIKQLQVFTNKSLQWLEERVVGGSVWLITGGGRPRRYFLCQTFVADEMRPARATGFEHAVLGKCGTHFGGLRIDGEPWFREFQGSQGNFAFGLNPVESRFVEDFERSLIAQWNQGGDVGLAVSQSIARERLR
jgi:hypothetical protein